MEEKRKDEQTKILKERRNERKKERQAHKNGKRKRDSNNYTLHVTIYTLDYLLGIISTKKSLTT